LHTPFDRLEDLLDDEIQNKVPEQHQGLATALKLRGDVWDHHHPIYLIGVDKFY
jgi:hypothetical protein